MSRRAPPGIFIVRKGIRDYVDEHKNDGHRDAAAVNSAAAFRILVSEKAFALEADD